MTETPSPQTSTDIRDGTLSQLDSGIRPFVEVLRSSGVETFESCQGGEGHSSPEPMVRFYGDGAEGYRAFSVAMTYGLPVRTLNRGYHVDNGELIDPYWEMLFRNTA